MRRRKVFDEGEVGGESAGYDSDDVGGESLPTEERAEKVKGSPDGAELTELQRGFKERAQREQQRFEDAVDSEYWICVCFQSRPHKEAFLRAIGLLEYGDKYLDGDVVADAVGLPYDYQTRRPEWGQDKVPPEALRKLTEVKGD